MSERSKFMQGVEVRINSESPERLLSLAQKAVKELIDTQGNIPSYQEWSDELSDPSIAIERVRAIALEAVAEMNQLGIITDFLFESPEIVTQVESPNPEVSNVEILTVKDLIDPKRVEARLLKQLFGVRADLAEMPATIEAPKRMEVPASEVFVSIGEGMYVTKDTPVEKVIEIRTKLVELLAIQNSLRSRINSYFTGKPAIRSIYGELMYRTKSHIYEIDDIASTKIVGRHMFLKPYEENGMERTTSYNMEISGKKYDTRYLGLSDELIQDLNLQPRKDFLEFPTSQVEIPQGLALSTSDGGIFTSGSTMYWPAENLSDFYIKALKMDDFELGSWLAQHGSGEFAHSTDLVDVYCVDSEASLKQVLNDWREQAQIKLDQLLEAQEEGVEVMPRVPFADILDLATFTGVSTELEVLIRMLKMSNPEDTAEMRLEAVKLIALKKACEYFYHRDDEMDLGELKQLSTVKFQVEVGPLGNFCLVNIHFVQRDGEWTYESSVEGQEQAE